MQVSIDLDLIRRRRMLQCEFDPHRRSLRLERGAKFNSLVSVAPCKNQLCLVVWATTQSKHAPKMAFKFNM